MTISEGRGNGGNPHDEKRSEIWKSLGEEGIEWLARLHNVIFKTFRIPGE